MGLLQLSALFILIVLLGFVSCLICLLGLFCLLLRGLWFCSGLLAIGVWLNVLRWVVLFRVYLLSDCVCLCVACCFDAGDLLGLAVVVGMLPGADCLVVVGVGLFVVLDIVCVCCYAWRVT